MKVTLAICLIFGLVHHTMSAPAAGGAAAGAAGGAAGGAGGAGGAGAAGKFDHSFDIFGLVF